MEINFNNNYREFSPLENSSYQQSIHNVIDQEHMDCNSVDVIWLDDESLQNMHEQYLDDPTLTDVMTFDNGDNQIEAEIYISVDRAIEQAKQYNVSLENELNRLVIHGLLHLAGYDDHSEADIKVMREKEAFYLNQL